MREEGMEDTTKKEICRSTYVIKSNKESVER